LGGGWGWHGGWRGWRPFEEDITTFASEHPHDILILTKQKMLDWRGQATVENPSNSRKNDEKQTKQGVGSFSKAIRHRQVADEPL